MSDYYTLLKDPRWQKKRLKIMERDKFTCLTCGEEATTLNVHHGYYIKDKQPWEYPDNSLHTLCESCHLYERDVLDYKIRLSNTLSEIGFRKDDFAYITAHVNHMYKYGLDKYKDRCDFLKEIFDCVDGGGDV